MAKYLLATAAFFVFVVSLNAQITINSYLNDDYCRWWGFEKKVTTELIQCSPTSNVYTRIDIHREHGVPRYGIVMDCASNTLDTVWYIPKFTGKGNGLNAPKVTDTSITVYWEETPFSVRIMDVLTGDIVINTDHKGQPSSLFATFFPSDTLHLSDAPGGPITKTISFPGGVAPRAVEDFNPGATVDYSGLADGLYFLYIVDVNRNLIQWMVTIRKGI